ncbi:cyclic nucleotide-gated cation channel [Plakobranchus ocellatus]|uniref:Cyclic nucleotide-gated cation channel n=1 Tax=Plakobranchus ocellatus TaxID=259542 RepID=A0AAV4DKE2_9GAST|nr:cyclic nucleotide-gated cation channel [Plakobranchus ocellatus]
MLSFAMISAVVSNVDSLVWFLCIASPQQGDFRLSGPPPSRGAGGDAGTRGRGIHADLRADSLATMPPMPLTSM